MTDESIKVMVNWIAAAESIAKAMDISVSCVIEMQLRVAQMVTQGQADPGTDLLEGLLHAGPKRQQ